MAGTGVGKYSTTASSNTSVHSTNWAEGMAPVMSIMQLEKHLLILELL